jgi:hypothetical protein
MSRQVAQESTAPLCPSDYGDWQSCLPGDLDAAIISFVHYHNYRRYHQVPSQNWLRMHVLSSRPRIRLRQPAHQSPNVLPSTPCAAGAPPGAAKVRDAKTTVIATTIMQTRIGHNNFFISYSFLLGRFE